MMNKKHHNNHNHNTHQSSLAIEIAVDAHATRLLRQHSPPEANVDYSSLGPYVTSVLRECLSCQGKGGDGSIGGNDSSVVITATNDLIELLEGQCQMAHDTASVVIANIDRAVRTGDVVMLRRDCSDDHRCDTSTHNSYTNNLSNKGGGNRTRSKSLGSEPMAYDVNFLGKILQDAMMMPSHSLDSSPVIATTKNDGGQSSIAAAIANKSAYMTNVERHDNYIFSESSTSCYQNRTATEAGEDVTMGILRPSSSTYDSAAMMNNNYFNQNNNNNNKAASRSKQRSVTFDETQSSSLPSTSFSWYNDKNDSSNMKKMMMTSSVPSSPAAIAGHAVIEENDDVHLLFDHPLGGILDVLDLEEEGGEQQQQNNVMMDNISATTAISNKSLEQSEEDNEANMSRSFSSLLELQGGVSSIISCGALLPQCQMIIDPNQKDQPSSSSPPPSSSSSPSSSGFPALGEACDTTKSSLSQKPSNGTGKGRNSSTKTKKNKEANDLAAALFRPSRSSRSNSLTLDHPNHQRPRALSLASSSMLRSSSADAGVVFSAPSSGNGVWMMGSLISQSLDNAAATPAAAGNDSNIATTTITSDFNTTSSSSPPLACNTNSMQSELNSTTQLLLTLNSHLGTEAAALASQLTDGDLNLAQYLIEAARFDSSTDNRNSSNGSSSNRRSRICRHELRGTCYRSDCPYSHDLGGVTCLFWLRGRCRGENCRFMHGFSENLLDGISQEYLNERREDARKERGKELLEESKKIRTGNLLQHNQWATTSSSSGNSFSRSLPNSQGFMFLSPSQGRNDASMSSAWR